MTDERIEPEAAEPVPTAHVRSRRHRTVYLFWLVPLAAAVMAGYLVYSHLHEFGPTITIMFRDAAGLKVGQTEIRYRGVAVGEVSELRLSPDYSHVVVIARLRADAAGLAREGSLFWIVRPEVGFERVRGLATVITGPYVEVFPGSGSRTKTDFVGVDLPPATLGRSGLHVTLATSQLGSIRPRTTVYFRGIEVGIVGSAALSRDGTTAHVKVLIDQRYARLVRIGSRFWTMGDVDVRASLFRGIEVNVDSLRSLVAGGIAFATPEGDTPPARDGALFVLHDKPQKEWLTWAPKISLPGGD
jgi:paraquat-inducible protein B